MPVLKLVIVRVPVPVPLVRIGLLSRVKVRPLMLGTSLRATLAAPCPFDFRDCIASL